jgi:hypothetical protein
MTLKIDLDKELERKFRALAMKKYGYSKGAIKKALENAIEKWVREARMSKSETKVKDPVALMEGLLVELKGKKSSVELQHEAKKMWAKIGRE